MGSFPKLLIYFIACGGWNIFSLPPWPDRLWAHPVSYPVGSGGPFARVKAAGTWSWPLIYI